MHRDASALFLALVSLVTWASWGAAHYHMLLPSTPSIKRAETVTFTYQWGHPFEHQLFDAAAPQALFVIAPDRKRIDLLHGLEKGELKEKGKAVTVHRVRFAAEQRGDYVFAARCEPAWMEEEQEFLEDSVKVVIHVQAQKGWDTAAGLELELVPLTRPYGSQAGTVFQAQVLAEGKPLAGALVEVERYNPVPPKELPEDEQITRTAKTDPNGVVTCTLSQSGWWGVTAQRLHGQRQWAGKTYPVRQRATLWVYID